MIYSVRGADNSATDQSVPPQMRTVRVDISSFVVPDACVTLSAHLFPSVARVVPLLAFVSVDDIYSAFLNHDSPGQEAGVAMLR
jgi:hypothetical protein